MRIKITSDSTCDLDAALLEKYDITVSAFWCGWEGPCVWNFYEGAYDAVSPAIIFDHGVGDNTVISIDANGFPGTYTVVGKTYAKGTDGKDHLFTFLIFKAKVSAEANFEMSADGEDVELNEYQPMWEFENTVTKEVFKYDYIMQPYIIGDKKELTPGYYTVTFRYKLSDAYDRKEVKIGPVFIKK